MPDNPAPARPKSRRGGRRPGAGAPRGNLNAFRNGTYSERFFRGALMIALLPEVQTVLRALKQEDLRKHRDYFNQVIAAAFQATETDPVLADSIKRLIHSRIQEILTAAKKQK